MNIKARKLDLLINTMEIKTYRLKIFSAFFFFLFPLIAWAFELGDIRINSLLNEPLNAELTISEVKGISTDDILISHADRDLYQKTGFTPLDSVYTIKFKILRNPDSGKTVLMMSTLEPIKDPYIDLLLVVNWPDGKMVKEYTLLFDPPKIALASFKPKLVLEKKKKEYCPT